LRDSRTGALEREIDFERPIQTLEFSLAGDALAVVTDDNKVFALGSTADGPKLVATLRQPPTWVRFAADSTKLLLYENSNHVSQRDTASGKILTAFESAWSKSASMRAWILRLDPSGAFVAVRSPDNYIRVYQTADGKRISEINWDNNVFADMAFSSDAKNLLLVTEDGRFANWDIAADRSSPSLQLARRYSNYSSVTLERTPDPSQILAVDAQGHVDIYSLNFNSTRSFYSGEPEDDVHAALSPNGSLLATIGRSGMLRFWHVDARELLAEIPGQETYQPNVQFSPDGRFLAVTTARRGYAVYKAPSTRDELLRGARDLLARLPKPKASVSSPRMYRLGVMMRDLSADAAERHRGSAGQGAEVIEVVAESLAEAAGVCVGDVIVKVNGKPVASTSEASAAIKGSHLDLSLELVRDGQAVITRVALDD
jgi:WD40 repeat protein